MKRLKPYLPILYKLMIDVVLLGYDVIRQVILPNRRRKGNLLSSLFLLFAGLTDRLITFRQNVMMTPWSAAKWIVAPWITDTWTYGKKYLRQGMIIATWALFILSSFEWSGPAAQSVSSKNPQETTARIQLPLKKAPTAYAIPYRSDYHTPSTNDGGIVCKSSLSSPQATTQIWLRLCTLRI